MDLFTLQLVLLTYLVTESLTIPHSHMLVWTLPDHSTYIQTRSQVRIIKRICGRRDLPATLLSDNTKTFKSASKEVRSILRSREMLVYLSDNKVTWSFIVE